MEKQGGGCCQLSPTTSHHQLLRRQREPRKKHHHHHRHPTILFWILPCLLLLKNNPTTSLLYYLSPSPKLEPPSPSPIQTPIEALTTTSSWGRGGVRERERGRRWPCRSPCFFSSPVLPASQPRPLRASSGSKVCASVAPVIQLITRRRLLHRSEESHACYAPRRVFGGRNLIRSSALCYAIALNRVGLTVLQNLEIESIYFIYVMRHQWIIFYIILTCLCWAADHKWSLINSFPCMAKHVTPSSSKTSMLS